MYELAEHEVSWQRDGEFLREVALGRPTPMAREDRQTRPYVVRDLSWEVARFLDAKDFRAIAFATPGGANGNSAQPK